MKAIPIARVRAIFDDLRKRDPKADLRGVIVLAFATEGATGTSWAETRAECASLGKTLDAIFDAMEGYTTGGDGIVPWPAMRDERGTLRNLDGFPVDIDARPTLDEVYVAANARAVADVAGWIRNRAAKLRGPPADLLIMLAEGIEAEAPWKPSCDGTPAEFPPVGSGVAGRVG